MKKIALAILILLALVLAACNTTSSGTQTTSATPNSSSVILPVQTELILGTFKLEGTAQAISAEQAATLLPLWQVYQDLSASDTAAQAEMDALVGQIQATMTSDQLAAIDDMNLTQQDIMAVMVEQNVIETAQQQTTSSQSSSTVSQGAPSGAMPAGDIPAGDPGAGVMQPQTTSSTQTDTTQSAASQDSATIPSALLDALIQLLESKAA